MHAGSMRRGAALCGAVALAVWLLVQGAGLTRARLAPWALYLEAEQGQVVAPVVRVQDVLTSGCAYLLATGRGTGSVTLTFAVPTAGNYYLWARVMGESLVENSFLFSVDGGVPAKYEFQPFHGVWTWGWDRVRAEKTPGTTPVVLAAGTHTLRFDAREPKARLDAVVITDDVTYVPLGIDACPIAPSPTPTPAGPPMATPSPNPNATPTPVVVQMEAEWGQVVAPLAVAEDPLASRCGYVFAPQRGSGSVSLSFTVPVAGDYYPWARAMGQSLNNNSFWFSVDGGPLGWSEIPNPHGDWTWVWYRLHAYQQQPITTPLTLAGGTHTLLFQGRESGSRLDAVVITNDPEYNPLYRPGSGMPCVVAPTATRTATPTPTPWRTPGAILSVRTHLPAILRH